MKKVYQRLFTLSIGSRLFDRLLLVFFSSLPMSFLVGLISQMCGGPSATAYCSNVAPVLLVFVSPILLPLAYGCFVLCIASVMEANLEVKQQGLRQTVAVFSPAVAVLLSLSVGLGATRFWFYKTLPVGWMLISIGLAVGLVALPKYARQEKRKQL